MKIKRIGALSTVALTFSFAAALYAAETKVINVAPNDIVFVYSGDYQSEVLGFTATCKGDDTFDPSKVVWSLKDESPKVGGTVVADSGEFQLPGVFTYDSDYASEYSFEIAKGTLTIEKATLTVKAEDKSVAYGDAAPEYTLAYSGFVPGEDESVLTVAPTATSTYTSTTGAGTLPITVSGGEAANYKFAYEAGVLTIGKATLTVKAEDKSVTYGDAAPEYTLAYSGFVNGEDESVLTVAPTATSTYTSTTGAGKLPVTVSGGEAANYNFAYEEGVLTVARKAIEVRIAGIDKQTIFDNSVQQLPMELGNTFTADCDYASESMFYDATKIDSAKVVSGQAAGAYPYELQSIDFSYLDDNITATFSIDSDGTLTIEQAEATAQITGVVSGEPGAAQTVEISFTLAGLVEGIAYTLDVTVSGPENFSDTVPLGDKLSAALANGTANGDWTLAWTPPANTPPDNGELPQYTFAIELASKDANVVCQKPTVAEGVSTTVSVDTRARRVVTYADATGGDERGNSAVAIEGAVFTQTFTNNIPGTLSDCLWTRRGYDFDCWTNSVAPEIAYAGGEEVTFDDDNEIDTLCASWTPQTYAVAYVLDGDYPHEDIELLVKDKEGAEGVSLAGSLVTSYSVEDEFALPEAPVRFGYAFAGWSCNDKTLVPDAAVSPSAVVEVSNWVGDLEFTANWTKLEGELSPTDDPDAIDGNTDLTEPCTVTLIINKDLDHTITIPAAVTNLVLKFEGSHTLTASAGLAMVIFENAATDLEIQGAFTLAAPPQSVPGPLLGKGGASFRLVTPSRSLTGRAALGASAVQEGGNAVEVAGISRDPASGKWQVQFRVALKDGQDFNAWLYRANLAARIKIRAAESLEALRSPGGDGVTIYDATTDALEISGDSATGIATYTVPAPENAKGCFFEVVVE